MCLVAVALRAHPRWPLVVASNRDEWFERPSAALGWWDEAPDLLAGRDRRAGGTWLGLSRGGRIGIVTNIRDARLERAGAPSRGELVAAWLRRPALKDGDVSAFAMAAHARGHAGFNLLLGDWRRPELAWFSSRQTHPQALDDGVHGLSNADLDTPWPKVQRLKARLAQALAGVDSGRPEATAGVGDRDALMNALFTALADTRPAPDAELPTTGVPLDIERALSAAHIHTADGRYGTRAATVVVVERDDATATGAATPVAYVSERQFDTTGALLGQRVVAMR